ncbi:hypothetical protein ACFYO5_22630 [Streptomyces sp. NPDC006259]|uniref:hypothetical protein n=1 Tax=Streptomyces sp. NPDC006259 TaxID=3364740 RepID=UPI00367A2E24
MDSTGIDDFVAAPRTFAEAGDRIRLAAPGAAVTHTLRIFGVDAVIACREALRRAPGD